jgi:microcystin-dependent protein
MSPLAPTANLGLAKPEPSVTVGPAWAQMINDCLNLIDTHDHTAGKGVRVPSDGLNINGDLTFNNHDATDLRSVRMQLGSSVLAEPADKGCVYVNSGNLYYNNGSGAAVQITSGTSVISSITGAFSASAPGAYPYTVSAGDAQKVLLVDTTSARTINLPVATTALLFAIKDTSGNAWTNNISVVPNGANTIDGATGTRRLVDNRGWWFFVSDGVSNWSIGAMRETDVPVGTLQMFGGAAAPAGYLLCNGAAVSRTTYAPLFAAISTAFGVGDGSTTFNVPDMRQRFPLGVAATGTGATLGGTGGSIDHTHTVPAHYHGMGAGANLAISASGSHVHDISHGHTTSSAGSHNHDISHGHTGSTGSAGSHFHYMLADQTSTSSITEAGSGIARSFDATNDFSYDLKQATGTVDRTRTSTVGDHTHSVTINAHSGNSGTVADHTHTVSSLAGNSAANTHTHASGDFTGNIGLVTGGVNGNAAMTSGPTNPPFIALNYIIKV